MSRINKFAKMAVLASAGLAPGLALASNTTVCSIPTGRDGINYAHEGVAEMRAVGPAALAVAADGSFWVADTVSRRLLHYSSTCSQLGIVELRNVVGISDVAATNSSLFVFDRAAASPTVVHLSLSGTEYGRYTVDADVTGLALGERGELLTEHKGGASFKQLLDSSGKLSVASLPGMTKSGMVYNAVAADMSKVDASTGTITVGSRTVEVKVPNAVGGLRVLGIQGDGSFFVKMEEVSLPSDFRVDQTVRYYDMNGNLRGMARVPLQGLYTYVENGLATGAAGAYALVTFRDRAEIQKLGFSDSLAAILPVVTTSTTEPAPITGQCRSSTDMANTASWITGFQRAYSSTNVDGYCAGRTKPRFLGGAGIAYTGEAYDWGGWDNPTNYDNLLYQNYQAGDINTAGVESCSRGLDCSGLVSLAWGTTSKYGTSTLPNISWQLGSRSGMARGDIMNCAGSHVVLFDYYNGNGLNVWEATTSNYYDRAVYVYRDWGYFGSCYVPRRYNSKC